MFGYMKEKGIIIINSVNLLVYMKYFSIFAPNL